MNPQQENLGLVVTFVATMAGLMRLVMMQHRRLADQFVQFLEGVTDRMLSTLDQMSQTLTENTVLVRNLHYRGQSDAV
jgi:hypothetical protein